MRFRGQVRFEDKDSADLDVTVEVGDTHVRLDSGDESLGSWCLADVLAERLVANQFALNLAGESVVFLAEDQVNFAYGAVQSMAEGWARYHAMNVLMRRRAVSSARRRNEPSRLEEARQAFIKARQALLDSEIEAEEASRVSQEVAVEEPALPEPTPPALEDGAVTDHEAVPKFWDKVIQARDETPGVELHTTNDTVPVAEAPPGPPASPDVGSGEEQAPVSARHARIRRLDAFPRRSARGDDHPEPVVEPTPEPVPVPVPEPEPVPEPPEPVPEPEPPPVPEPVPTPEWEAPPPTPQQEQRPEPEPESVPKPTPLPTPRTGPTFHPFEPGEGGARDERPQVAIGTYADGRHPAETSGLRAMLKERFGRSKGEHTHTMVQSTTAVGLTRNVCIECGYVSIGVVE